MQYSIYRSFLGLAEFAQQDISHKQYETQMLSSRSDNPHTRKVPSMTAQRTDECSNGKYPQEKIVPFHLFDISHRYYSQAHSHLHMEQVATIRILVSHTIVAKKYTIA